MDVYKKKAPPMQYLFVANWKMRMHFNDALQFCTANKEELIHLGNSNPLIICPSFISISSVHELLKDGHIKIAAQDCSPFKEGSHTGEVSAISLSQAGCTYCIVGHTERRAQFNETNESVAEKMLRVLENNMTPIICLGESELDAANSRTYTVLQEQLEPIFAVLRFYQKKSTIIFAYEPAWAIGTGIVPEHSYLQNMFHWLQETISQALPDYSCKLLYGGSVDEHSIIKLTRITAINGFLIGSASTNFTQLRKIIKSAQDAIL